MMKTAVMTERSMIQFVDRPIPFIREDEVLVKVGHVGICGSDLHYFEHGRIGDFVVEYPFVLGHEVAGTVVQTGRFVNDLKIGDRVALEPGIPCGQCEYCLGGKYNLCDKVNFFATPPVDGAFQEYVAHKSAYAFKLPDNISTLEGALIEPLAVGFHAANQSEAKPGQTAIIFGAGCIGLMTMMALHAKGIEKVSIVDVIGPRLEMALRLGATQAIDASEAGNKSILDSAPSCTGFDIAIDTSGVESSIRSAVHALKKGATLVFIGYSKSGIMEIPLSVAMNKEIQFQTVFRYRNVYPTAIEAIAQGRLNPGCIVSDIYDFKDIQIALEQGLSNRAKTVKSVIRFT